MRTAPHTITVITGDTVATVKGRAYWEAMRVAEERGQTVAEYVSSLVGMTVDQAIDQRMAAVHDELISRLHALNYSDYEISRAINRSATSVAKDRKRLGLVSLIRRPRRNEKS